jgi:predicted nicotinamide N-methyase
VDRILARMEGRYATQTETVNVAGHVLSIRSVRDTNALLDMIDPETFMDDERLPYWAELWPSAIALARWVFSYPGLKERRVLELGCGLGLAGIAAAKAGARVTMTDYDEDALMFARFNASLNLGEAASGRSMDVALMDWRSPSVGKDFEVVIGSDILYERRHHDWVLDALPRLLAPSGVALLTDPGRETGRVFADAARNRGYMLEAHNERVEWRGRVHAITGLLLRPPEAGS